MSDWIGDFEMISVLGQPMVPTMRFVLEAMPGVDGEAIYQTGMHSDLGRLISTIDVDDTESGQWLYREYVGSIGELVRIQKAGFSFPDIDYRILGVELLDNQNMLTGVGGVNYGQTILRCGWDVLPQTRAPTE